MHPRPLAVFLATLVAWAPAPDVLAQSRSVAPAVLADADVAAIAAAAPDGHPALGLAAGTDRPLYTGHAPGGAACAVYADRAGGAGGLRVRLDADPDADALPPGWGRVRLGVLTPSDLADPAAACAGPLRPLDRSEVAGLGHAEFLRAEGGRFARERWLVERDVDEPGAARFLGVHRGLLMVEQAGPSPWGGPVVVVYAGRTPVYTGQAEQASAAALQPRVERGRLVHARPPVTAAGLVGRRGVPDPCDGLTETGAIATPVGLVEVDLATFATHLPDPAVVCEEL